MRLKVKQIMNKQIIAALPSDTVEEVSRLMRDYNIGCVPVVSAGKLKGILTDRDIVLKCVAKNKNPKKLKVSEIMSQNTTFITPEKDVNDAIKLMAAFKIIRLPVLDNGILDGILSLSDILKYYNGLEILTILHSVNLD